MAKTTIALPGIVPTTRGNLIKAGASGIQGSLAIGANKTYLRSDGTDPAWQAPPYASYQSYATYSSYTSVIPLDNTIPLSSEGTELFTASVTLSLASSRVRITVNGLHNNSGGGSDVVALFRSSTCLDAIADASVGAATPQAMSIVTEDTPGSVGPHTYSVRIGPAANTMYINGNGSNRLFGGAASWCCIIQEIFA